MSVPVSETVRSIVFVAEEWWGEMGENEKAKKQQTRGGKLKGILWMWEVGLGCLWEGLRAVSPLVGLRRGGPFSQLLVSSLSPLGITAEAVAALRRPSLGRQWRETNLTHCRLWGPSRSLPTAQANRDEFILSVGATYLLITLQCYSATSSLLLLITWLLAVLIITQLFFFFFKWFVLASHHSWVSANCPQM